jgi:hypothetical protein
VVQLAARLFPLTIVFVIVGAVLGAGAIVAVKVRSVLHGPQPPWQARTRNA